MVLGPAWTRGEIEKPAGTRSMGSYSILFYTPEQQARLGVDEQGNKTQTATPAAAPQVAAPAVRVVSQTTPGVVAAPTRCGAIGPAWTRGEIEKPAGTRNMGTWTAGFYTEEQQARLGVDENGQKRAVSTAATISSGSAVASTVTSQARVQALGPAWTRGEIEKPAGTKNMGTYSILVYTAEQQARLGVDEEGKKRPTSPGSPAQGATNGSAGGPCKAIGPAWTRGEIEKPALTKDMGSYKILVYSEEQQQRLGVDESGNKRMSPTATAKSTASIPARQVLSSTSATGSATGGPCKAIGPAWTRGEIEKPALTKDMGTYKILVYSEEQQRRLGVDEYGKKVSGQSPAPPVAAPAPAATAMAPGSSNGDQCRAIGPAWTRGEIEKPALTKDMGTYKILVYSEEQQRRLGVDEAGRKIGAPAAPATGQAVVRKVVATGAAPPGAAVGGCRAIGPAWTRGEIEKPQGTKSMGTWTALVYTKEQQERLGVDEQGKKVAAPATKKSGPPGQMEKPQGIKDMGLHSIGVYTEEQQARLGVDERGRPRDEADKTTPAPLAATGPGARSIEKPQGIKDMGSYAVGVYTEEQQARLGVDERGCKL